MVFAEGIFKGETLVIHPPESKLSNHLSVPLFPPKDNPVDIHIKVNFHFSSSFKHLHFITCSLDEVTTHTGLGKTRNKKTML